MSQALRGPPACPQLVLGLPVLAVPVLHLHLSLSFPDLLRVLFLETSQ
jgi:hypothetical protein